MYVLKSRILAVVAVGGLVLLTVGVDGPRYKTTLHWCVESAGAAIYSSVSGPC